MTADDCLQAIRPPDEYLRIGRCVFLTEAPMRLAYRPDETVKIRRVDAWQIECHASRAFEVTAYEVKVARGDFRRDAANRAKRRYALLHSNRFYYVTPEGLFAKPDDEVPVECGLIEVRIVNGSPTARRVIVAPHREATAPTWELVAALCRRSYQVGCADMEARLRREEERTHALDRPGRPDGDLTH